MLGLRRDQNSGASLFPCPETLQVTHLQRPEKKQGKLASRGGKVCPVARGRICRVCGRQKHVDQTRESSCLAFVLMLGFPDWVPRLSSPSEGTMLPFALRKG